MYVCIYVNRIVYNIFYLFNIAYEQYTIRKFKRQDAGYYTCVFDDVTHTMQLKG